MDLFNRCRDTVDRLLNPEPKHFAVANMVQVVAAKDNKHLFPDGSAYECRFPIIARRILDDLFHQGEAALVAWRILVIFTP